MPSNEISDQTFPDRLAAAVEAGHVVPWFQPVMDTDGIALLSAEAFPRWDDPVAGVIPAGAFITQAIRTDTLAVVSGALHARAFAALAEWRARGLAPRRMSFNLTGDELCSGAVLDRMLWALDHAQVSPREIAVEVTEDVLHGARAGVAATALGRLKGLGVEVCLDDFGAGPCDPAVLDRVGFATAKVAMAIVGRLGEDDAAEQRLQDLARLAQSRGVSIIAKGVETRIQIDLLTEVGCDGQQGFAIARPMPEDSFVEWLDLNTWPSEVFVQGASA
ncbi:EAL domain-containing protein [Limibaculum sp. FT325]|uniref:EAL domain-containing protein n=1 Tax=Thermohalobaculum sediminis TaxID=2939436 RepID=UPI0020BEAF8F|nr:EAL domain-containing protein [Limibaculum sediminis]MCL5776522.1 EAL domain-containing protein [Limibaculum sediminis]